MTSIEASNTQRGSGRIDGVDLLRGVAIFFVLMNHVNMRLLGAEVHYTDGLPKQLVSSLVWNGQFGVQIFFAVSGFLITATTLRRWGSLSRVSLRGFYLMRFARIVPLLLSLLVVLSLLHFAHVKYFVVSAKTGGIGRALFAALTLPCQRAGGSERIPARQLGYFVVAFRGRNFLSLLSASCAVPRPWKDAYSAALGPGRDGTIRTHGAHSRQ